jgi:hypothetical protein
MPIDIDLLNRHKARESDLITEAGCFTNWLGLRTEAGLFGAADRLNDRIFPALPENDDGVYGGYLEYASLLTAIESVPEPERFVAIELGAGWGPWISAVGVVCRRLGFRNIILRGVEADEARTDFMRRHLARNGLMDQPGIDCRVIAGAAWTEDTMLHFPIVDPRDHGGAASVGADERDYRGGQPRYSAVPGLSLPTICQGLDLIDYMHWDIQGAELAVAKSAADFLNAHVRYLFIGTHSRPIEGGLIAFFYEQQWDVVAERPCAFTYNRLVPSLEGMTTTDGDLFLRNPRL